MKNKREIIIRIGLILIGLFAGWLIFGHQNNAPENKAVSDTTESDSTQKRMYTCAMHPQIRQDHPGKCPICGMTLIPVGSGKAHLAKNEMQMSKEAAALANVQTTKAFQAVPERKVYLTGTVKADERLISVQTAHIPGRIDRLFVNFTGQVVHKGERLATVYSPELITAEKELFEAMKYKDANSSLVEATIEKLKKSWKLTDAQIDAIQKSGEVQTEFNILADFTGIVSKRIVSIGDYVKEGSLLMEIENLSHVWILFDAYESDLPWVKLGDKIDFTVNSMPGKIFTSKITFINPVIDAQTRVALVRAEMDNPGMQLKPDMFAKGTLISKLPVKTGQVLIPKTAVLWTGKRSIVYVQDTGFKMPTFRLTEVTLGPEAGENYVVEKGLKAGDPVVSNGVFQVDAAAQLAGKPSMMNPDLVKGDAAESISREEVKGSWQIKPVFKVQLFAAYQQYIKLKNALVNSDAEKAKSQAIKVKTTLNEIDMELLQGDAQKLWMSTLKPMKEALNVIASSTDLAEQRKAFSMLSDNLYISLKKLGPDKGMIYRQYCPMAMGNEGAYWLSDIQEIRNPYFGKAMLSCGETREKF